MDSVKESAEQKYNILVVDDEDYICKTICRWLAPEGYQCARAHDAENALSALNSENYDLVISDIIMPGRNGIDLLCDIKERFPDMAVIMATAVDNRETAINALQIGAYGYMIKPFDKNEFIINVANALERRRHSLISKNYEKELEQEVRSRTELIRKREEEIASRLVWAAEYRDDDTGQHIKRIGLFSATLAEGIGWSTNQVDDIKLAAPMHDVGKIGISDNILLKPGSLSPKEFEIVKKHTTIGASILGGSNIPILELACNIALSHHEKWDGSGYPEGLAGKDIPESARIVAIADVYDALVYDRVYRPAFSEEQALIIMKEGVGKHFDKHLFQCFLDNLPTFREIRKNHSNN